ncbi:hypothetical protein POM88_025666 [Heracleum sosnowskyi]|uniref:Secreted protein n=1 Tax=Heracleum sosnowskyi TaxID=360622 RepID=A0AAD8I4D5_9APIA|nr:hypothetical protein POM88_025666 [Heracleum sosnowskyi]
MMLDSLRLCFAAALSILSRLPPSQSLHNHRLLLCIEEGFLFSTTSFSVSNATRGFLYQFAALFLRMAATRLYQGIYTLLVVCNMIILARGVDLPYVTRLVKLTYLHSAMRQGAGKDGSFCNCFGDSCGWFSFRVCLIFFKKRSYNLL